MKAFKYRLYPTCRQAAVLQFTLDRNRELYNAALEERREAWRMSRVSVTYAMQSAQLPEIKEIRPEYKEGSGSNPNDIAERRATPEQGSQKIYPPAVSHYL